jgi:hypothetical protein
LRDLVSVQECHADEPLAPATDHQLALTNWLQHLSLKLVPGSAAPTHRSDSDHPTKATLDASPEDSALPDGTPVLVDPIDGGWLVHLGSSITIEVGHATWRESSPLGRPVVATGAWQHTTFIADLYVITTPPSPPSHQRGHRHSDSKVERRPLTTPT